MSYPFLQDCYCTKYEEYEGVGENDNDNDSGGGGGGGNNNISNMPAQGGNYIIVNGSPSSGSNNNQNISKKLYIPLLFTGISGGLLGGFIAGSGGGGGGGGNRGIARTNTNPIIYIQSPTPQTLMTPQITPPQRQVEPQMVRYVYVDDPQTLTQVPNFQNVHTLPFSTLNAAAAAAGVGVSANFPGDGHVLPPHNISHSGALRQRQSLYLLRSTIENGGITHYLSPNAPRRDVEGGLPPGG